MSLLSAAVVSLQWPVNMTTPRLSGAGGDLDGGYFVPLAEGMLQEEPPAPSTAQRGRRDGNSLVSQEKAVYEPKGMFPQVWLESHLQHQVFEFSASFCPARAMSRWGSAGLADAAGG